jgi:hypothetical protein
MAAVVRAGQTSVGFCRLSCIFFFQSAAVPGGVCHEKQLHLWLFRNCINEWQGDYTFKLSMLENIIVQNEITDGLDTKEQNSLLKSSLEKYLNIENDEIYGFNSITFTGRIISKISFKLGNLNLKSKIEMPDIQEFIKTGLLKDRESLLNIINEAKKINTNE